MIKLPLQPVMQLFQSRVTLFDATFTRDASGRELPPAKSADRMASGIIQPAGDRLLQFAANSGLVIQDGAYVLHTRAVVNAVNLTAGSAATAAGVQTYCRHNGFVWKAWGLQNWAPHQAIGRYLLTRYLDPNAILV